MRATPGFATFVRMLGFGLLEVLPNGQVEILVSPSARMPRKNILRLPESQGHRRL